MKFKRGDIVVSEGQDSYFKGRFLCYVEKFPWTHPITHQVMGKGEVRCMVQSDHGIMLTKNPAHLRRICKA